MHSAPPHFSIKEGSSICGVFEEGGTCVTLAGRGHRGCRLASPFRSFRGWGTLNNTNTQTHKHTYTHTHTHKRTTACFHSRKSWDALQRLDAPRPVVPDFSRAADWRQQTRGREGRVLCAGATGTNTTPRAGMGGPVAAEGGRFWARATCTNTPPHTRTCGSGTVERGGRGEGFVCAPLAQTHLHTLVHVGRERRREREERSATCTNSVRRVCLCGPATAEERERGRFCVCVSFAQIHTVPSHVRTGSGGVGRGEGRVLCVCHLHKYISTHSYVWTRNGREGGVEMVLCVRQ